jgi:hypothetical protein
VTERTTRFAHDRPLLDTLLSGGTFLPPVMREARTDAVDWYGTCADPRTPPFGGGADRMALGLRGDSSRFFRTGLYGCRRLPWRHSWGELFSLALVERPGYPPCVEQDQPLLRVVFPDLVAELTALLEAEGERELAISAGDLRLFGECGCRDDFCQSIQTADHPRGQPFGEGHRCVPLLPSKGMVNLDVVHGRIMYVEILDRPPMLRQDAQP